MPKTIETWRINLAGFGRALDAGARIITVDPSSKRTGVAVHDASAEGRLVHAGAIQPKSKATAYERIDFTCDALAALIDTYGVTAAAIEVSTGKTSSRHRGHGAGLAIYGAMVGAARRVLHERLKRSEVLDVLENDWTRRTSKAQRWAFCKANYPSHAEVWAADEGDRKCDVSDATYLYHWCKDMYRWCSSA